LYPKKIIKERWLSPDVVLFVSILFTFISPSPYCQVRPVSTTPFVVSFFSNNTAHIN